jgi:hypothetical protein
MPSRQISLIGLNRDLRNASEVDTDHRGDIGNSELIASDKASIS